MDGFSDAELLDIYDEYAEKHPNFYDSFGESLSEALSEYGSLTEGQRIALENIITRFRMTKK